MDSVMFFIADINLAKGRVVMRRHTAAAARIYLCLLDC